MFVEVAEVAAGVLDGLVEGVDVGVGFCGDGDGPVVGVVANPVVGDPVELGLEVGGSDSVVLEVGVERRCSADAEAVEDGILGQAYERLGMSVPQKFQKATLTSALKTLAETTGPRL